MGIPAFGTLGRSRPNPHLKSTDMRLGGRVMPPRGWQAFRERVEDAIGGVGVVPHTLVLEEGNLQELGQLNNEVNHEIRYTVEEDGQDYWEIAHTKGDCEDIALLKREDAVLNGYPRGCFRLAHCTTLAGRGHAVLIVTTDQGWYVMDNIYPGIHRWHTLPYRWNAVEVPGAFFWRRVVS